MSYLLKNCVTQKRYQLRVLRITYQLMKYIIYRYNKATKNKKQDVYCTD